MNFVSINGSNVVGSHQYSAFNDAMVLGYFTGLNFDVDAVMGTVLTGTVPGPATPTQIQLTSVSFQTVYNFSKDICNTIMKDTSCNESYQPFNKPYAVAGRIVALCFPNAGSFNDSFKSDVGDFIQFSFPYPNPDGSDDIEELTVILGVCNSTLTDAYTPFSAYAGTSVQINYYELQEILSLSKGARDPFMNGVKSGSVPLSFHPHSQGGTLIPATFTPPFAPIGTMYRPGIGDKFLDLVH